MASFLRLHPTDNVVVAVAGLATFNGCAINSAGSGYTLAATSAGLTSATSSVPTSPAHRAPG